MYPPTFALILPLTCTSVISVPLILTLFDIPVVNSASTNLLTYLKIKEFGDEILTTIASDADPN